MNSLILAGAISTALLFANAARGVGYEHTVWPNSVQPLVECPKCNLEMRLFGTGQAESDVRDLYTFECGSCAGLK